MQRRLGYACVNLTLGRPIRTVRLANATRDRLRDVGLANLETVREMARWNAAHGIRMMRVSSDLVPFAGRADVNEWWRDDLRDAFRETGTLLRQLDQRVSAHPGQFTVLSSPRAEVVAAALADLEAQSAWFDAMNVFAELILHVGGAYGEPKAALARFVENAGRLSPHARARLVVENDDKVHAFSAALEAAEGARVPLVFDPFHHGVLPDPGGRDVDAALREALGTWRRFRPGRTPKIHWSDPATGKRKGSHADMVDAAPLAAFLARHPEPFDVMLEAKAKERALLAVLDAWAPAAGSTPRLRQEVGHEV